MSYGIIRLGNPPCSILVIRHMFDIHKHSIGVFAPSSYVEPAVIDAGADVLRAAGFQVQIHPQTYLRRDQTQMAGSEAQKTAAFRDLFFDDSVGAIIAAGGGNRATLLLPDFVDIMGDKAHKPLIGHSDFTSILNCSRNNGYFGPMLNWCDRFSGNTAEQYVQALKGVLSGEMPRISLDGGSCVRSGQVKGHLYGGTHSVFQALLGTPFMPDLKGAVLFLEDVGEELSRIDRLFATLSVGGHLNQIGGLICGQYLNCLDTGRPFGLDLVDIIKEHCTGLNIPIVINAPFGHGRDLPAIPIGCECDVEFLASGSVVITPSTSS